MSIQTWFYHNKNTSSGTDGVCIPEKVKKNHAKKNNGMSKYYSDLLFKLLTAYL